MKKRIKNVGKKRARLGAIFDVRLFMKYALDADDPETYNRRLADLKQLVNTMEMA